MDELVSRGCRVAGMLVAMLGAGFVLESTLYRSGLIVMLAGVVLFLSGFLRRRGDAAWQDETMR